MYACEPVRPAVLDDLRRRLSDTRAVPLPGGLGWSRGTDADYLADLVGYWAEGYDWRVHEQRLLALPWTSTGSGSSTMHVIHQRSSRADAPVVLLLHGWPDSVLRFSRVLPLLDDLHVVVPALPGFPFGTPVTRPGMSVTAMAELVAGSMAELGYERFVVSGGDVGGDVAEQLAAAHPDRVLALHLPNVSPRHLLTVDPGGFSQPEEEYAARARQFQQTEGGYLLEQRTRPHSLAVGLGDSPAGLAAWLVEKYRAWSDCVGDLESVFPRDDLLTWITAYWVTASIGTSFCAYVEPPEQPVRYIPVPTVFSLSPRDILLAPREFAERVYDVAGWYEEPAGGHFAPWERPDAFAAALRRAVVVGFGTA